MNELNPEGRELLRQRWRLFGAYFTWIGLATVLIVGVPGELNDSWISWLARLLAAPLLAAHTWRYFHKAHAMNMAASHKQAFRFDLPPDQPAKLQQAAHLNVSLNFTQANVFVTAIIFPA